MQYSVRNRRRLKQTGSTAALIGSAQDQERIAPTRASVPTVDEWLAVTTLERARE